jgi:prepilin-type N-terminal cleavage/methylation domain-containing protein
MTLSDPGKARGFTLLELILVMGILTFVAAAVAPRLGAFSVGRKTKDAAAQLLGLARYARAQAIAESRLYRLNFDAAQGTAWLTADNGNGVFGALSSDFGRQFQAPQGVKMTVDLTPQPNIQLNLPQNVQQETVPQSPPLDGRQSAQPGMLMQNLRQDGGSYVEFSPTGRCDPGTIRLGDRLGNTVEVSCASPSELFAIVQPPEASR